MPTNDVFTWSLEEVARRLHRGDISPLELTQLYLDRIDIINPTLNAYVSIMQEQALRAAERATEELARGHIRGLLHGVPISVKDAIPVRGHPTACGSRVSMYTEDAEAAVVTHLRQGGTIFLGKTSLPELGLGSFHPSIPPVRNPWDLERSAEGSSVGSAAAVAARLCLASIGSDAGGSIRRPAAHCGIVGLKPTYGCIDIGGIVASTRSMEHIGPLALSVTDTYLVLRAAVSTKQLACLPCFEHPAALNRQWRRDKSLPRVGIVKESLSENLEPEWQEAFEEAIHVLQGLGFDVKEVSIPSFTHAGSALMTIILVEAASTLNSYLTNADDLGTEASFWLELGRNVSGTAYVEAHQFRQKLVYELTNILQEVDILLGPVTKTLPPRLERVTYPQPGEESLNLGAQIQPTAPYNLTGLPALSLPCGFSSDKLPLGFQLASRPWHEGPLLAAAWLYEQETELWRQIPTALISSLRNRNEYDLNRED